jgi:hypothetical protein
MRGERTGWFCFASSILLRPRRAPQGSPLAGPFFCAARDLDFACYSTGKWPDVACNWIFPPEIASPRSGRRPPRAYPQLESPTLAVAIPPHAGHAPFDRLTQPSSSKISTPPRRQAVPASENLIKVPNVPLREDANYRIWRFFLFKTVAYRPTHPLPSPSEVGRRF